MKLLAILIPLLATYAVDYHVIATAESDQYSCMIMYTTGDTPESSNLTVFAQPATGATDLTPIAVYLSAEKQAYIRFHEADVVEFAQDSKHDKYSGIGLMLVNLSTWNGKVVRYSDAAEYSEIGEGYLLEPVVDRDHVAIVRQQNSKRERYYRVSVWISGTEWHDIFVLGAKEVEVRFEPDDRLSVAVNWGNERRASYLVDIDRNRFEIQ